MEEDIEALGAAAPPLPVTEELKPPAASVAQAASKTDSPRRKGKRPGRLGAVVRGAFCPLRGPGEPRLAL